MTLGERIMTLRMERQMSQSDLAEALEVSRQSISKWETDSSVPELEKLVMLCEIFGVSMDMLVRGIESERKPETECLKTEPAEVVHIVKFETRKIAGILLFICAAVCILTCAFMGDIMVGVFLALPFIICGIICLACRRRAGLWCVWTVYLYAAAFMRFATGISTGLLMAFLRGNVDFGINVIASIVAALLTVGLAAGTVWSFRNQDLRTLKNKGNWLVAGWAAYIILRFSMGKIFNMLMIKTGMWAVSMIYILLTDCIMFVILVFLLVWTYHWWKEQRLKKQNNL